MSDRVVKQVITVGGVGTILVVMLVVLVLLGNVLPLFQSNSVVPLASIPVSAGSFSSQKSISGRSASDSDTSTPVGAGVDEYGELLWVLHRGDYLTVHSIATGKQLSSHSAGGDFAGGESVGAVTPAGEPTGPIECCAIADNDASMVAGYSNGSIRPITLTIQVEFIPLANVPAEIATAFKTDVVTHEGALYRAMESGLVRKQAGKRSEVSSGGSAIQESQLRASTGGIRRRLQVLTSRNRGLGGQPMAIRLRWERSTTRSTVSRGPLLRRSATWTHVASTRQRRIASPSVLGLMIGSRSEQIQTLDAKGKVVTVVTFGREEIGFRFIAYFVGWFGEQGNGWRAITWALDHHDR